MDAQRIVELALSLKNYEGYRGKTLTECVVAVKEALAEAGKAGTPEAK